VLNARVLEEELLEELILVTDFLTDIIDDEDGLVQIIHDCVVLLTLVHMVLQLGGDVAVDRGLHAQPQRHHDYAGSADQAYVD